MGTLFVLLALVGLIAPIAAFVAFARTVSLQRRVGALERELRRLRQEPPADTAVALAPAAAEPVRAAAPEPARVAAAPPVFAQPPTGAPAPVPAPSSPAAPIPPAIAAAAGPLAPPAPPLPRLPPQPQIERPHIDWEKLLGVRAAAVVSAIALGLAGLLFFEYSIEHGLFPPWLRVVLGTMVGIASVAGSELALRQRYAGTANALAGGGLVVLYAAFWAASVRYELIGLLPGFVLMAAVTVSGCVLAWRHETELTAILALAGGFATPLLLASGTDRPFGLFGYLLMLDACLIYLATNRGWPRIAMLGLLGTVLYQAGWIGSRMGPERLWLGLGILGVFAFAFIAGTRRAASEKAPEWRITQAAAILLPFVFALYFAVDVRFAPSVLPVGLLLILLSVAAGWLARAQHAYELSLGAAAAGLGVLILWCAAPQPPLDPAWQLIAVAVGLAVVFHGFVELESRRSDWEGPAAAAVLAAVGQCGVLALAMTRAPDTVWPWVGGLTLLAAALVRHASLPERDVLGLVSPVLVALFLGLLSASHGGPRGTLAPVAFQALALAAAAAYQAVALWRGAKGSPPWAEHGAGACAGFLTAVCVSAVSNAPPAAFLGTTLALGLMMALVSARVASGAWLLAAVVMTTVAHAAFADTRHVAADADLGLAAGAAGVLVFTAWPFMAGSRLRADRFAWHAAALAGPLWFWPLRSLFVERFGDAAIGVLPLMLGAVALLAAFKARDSLRGAEPVRTPALAWLAAVALGFVSVAIPLQLEKSWITIGWALEGVAVLYLWTRLDHVGLKYFGLLLLAAVTVRLVTNVEVLMYYPRPAWRIVNWLMYTYLVPAAALLGSAQVLRRFELVRANSWERENVYHRGIALGAIGCGLAALGVIFVWLNLAIADWFATGQTLTLSFERLPARDLTTSIVWALYALILLGIGMARASIGLRWVSLGLLIVTNAKVFLHDLGELRDLYRVASLVGLAISLLAVSLAYQRFVFREVPGQEKT